MKWLARLKKIEIVSEVEATKPSYEPENRSFVGFVAPILAPMQKTGGDSLAANDPAVQVQAPPADNTTLAIDPDRWCWPHNDVMTGKEIDASAARLARFAAKGLIHTDGKALADKVVTRHRESDDRRLCLECTHLAGYGAGSWRCRDWQRAGIAIQARDAGLPSDLVRLLQRCNGFKAAH